ncbi:MAG: hypothetical protein IT317_05400 [Anaerolineales bacterium]|nr:hypothetical protein [Anaerolineales bacterium]
MPLNPWLLIALAGAVLTGGLLLYVWWRRRQEPEFELVLTCPTCGTLFDETTWKKRNAREHHQGRYTIVPVYVCPKCGEKLARRADGKPIFDLSELEK